MRRPAGNAGRVHTILPLVLITLSFFVLLSQGSQSPDLVALHSRQFSAKRAILARRRDITSGDGSIPASTNPVTATPTSSSTSFTSPFSSTSDSPTSTPASSTASSSSSSVAPTLVSSTSLTASSSSTSTSVNPSSTTVASVSSDSTTTSHSSTTSSALSSSPTSTITSSSKNPSSTATTASSLTSSSKAATLKVISASSSTTPLASTLVIATNIQGVSTSSATDSTALETSAQSSSTETASKGGFLSNTGAVAATFTIVGIVAVGGISGIFVVLRKRRRNSEEQDIFDTEYNDYSSREGHGGYSGNGDYFVSDMSSLSANAVSHAGAHNAEPDYGFGLPPPVGVESNRTSIVSNHAGYGAFRSATEARKPPMQTSGLRNETAWNSEIAYAEPAVEEDQSIYVVPSSQQGHSCFFAAQRAPGFVGTAH